VAAYFLADRTTARSAVQWDVFLSDQL